MCLIVARILQKMGYTGRCSFDLVLCGKKIEDAHLKFVECNGRWGGGSLPMTLMNRLFEDHRLQPYIHRKIQSKWLIRVRFSKFIEVFDDVLYSAKTNQGWAIVTNLALMTVNGHVDLITLGENVEQAEQRQDEFLNLISVP